MAKDKKRRKKRKPWVRRWWLEGVIRAVQEPFVLRQLQRAIQASNARFDAATSPEEKDWLADSEGEVVEGMLGMAFIACQLDITSVVSSCQKLHEFMPQLGPRPSRADLMVKNNPPVVATKHSKVAAIDGVANYFKHQDEWPADWTKLKPSSRAFGTAEVVKALGVKADGYGVMTGFTTIVGHSQYEGVLELREIVLNWARKLKTEYEEKMERRKLLPEAQEGEDEECDLS